MSFEFNDSNNMNIQPNSCEQPLKQEIGEKSKEEFENEVMGIKKELFENAGNKNKEELIQLIDDVEKIFSEEKESGKGKLKDKISEISNGEHGKEKFVDGSIAYLPKDGEAIFIGDTHGDPDAAVSIIEQEKFIEAMERGEKDKQLVFLGDYADRGKGDVENLEQIFALKQKYPDNVTLLRGNHEETDIGEGYGLLDSLKNKYGEKEGIELFKKYNEVFENMPGVLVCENGIVAVHGGIPSEDINSLKDLNNVDELFQMRWNDPIDYEGYKERDINTNRNGNEKNKISCFGKDAFKRFMDTIDGKVMVRAHEYGKDKPIFKNGLVTLFSNGSGGEKSHYKNINASYAKFDLEKEIDEIDNENIKKLKYVKPNYELKQLADDPMVVNEDMSFEDEPVNLNPDEATKQENEDSNVDDSFENGINEAEGFEDFERGVDVAIEEDREYQNKTEEKLKDWKDKPEEEQVEVVREKEVKLEKDLKENVKVPEDVLGETEKLREYQKELKKKNKKFIEEREDIMKKIQNQLDGGVDISSLDLGDQSEFKNVLSSFRNITKNTLDIEKMDYYLEAGENELGDLLDTHQDREITMETLERIMGQIDEFEEYLKKLEDMTVEQLEVAKGEVRGLLNKLNDIYNKNPELFKKLLAAGLVVGILILAAVVLGPGAAGMFEWASIAAPEIINMGAAGAVGTAKALVGFLGKGGSITAGALVGGGILLKVMSWLSNEENRDKLSKAVCGADFPGWYYALGGKKAGDKK